MADAHGSTAFETAIGRCGIAWNERGVTRTALPFADPSDLAAWTRRVGEPSPDPPPNIVAAIDEIAALLAGGTSTFQDVQLDLSDVGDLERRIYVLVRAIPPGRTRSYGEVAADLGDPALARAVGQAMARNPFPIIVPCHRVLAAGGRSGGFSAPGGIATKRRILAIEAAHAKRDGDLFA